MKNELSLECKSSIIGFVPAIAAILCCLSCREDGNSTELRGLDNEIRSKLLADYPNSDQVNFIIAMHESLVVANWEKARPRVRQGSAQFDVRIDNCVTTFVKAESSNENELQYLVTGPQIKGVIEVLHGANGQITQSVFKPWCGEMTAVRTVVQLEGASEVKF